MSRNLTKRILSLLLVLVLFVSSAPAAVFATEEETAQIAEEAMPRAVQADLAASIEQQIRAFAKSINMTGADDDAATAIARHGITGGGKTLNAGKNHALTATLLNSELGLATVIQGCTLGIQQMQQLNLNEAFVFSGTYWGSAPLSFFNNVYPEVPDGNSLGNLLHVCHANEKNYTGKTNGYDSSLGWIAGSANARTTITKASVTADTVTYNVTVSFEDRFDFSTSSNSGFQNLISGIGALLFKEFDWTATASFSLTVDNGCPHDTDAYYWRYDAGTQNMTSVTTDEFGGNQTEKYTVTKNGKPVFYYELERTVTLLHNVPWELEYTVKKPGYFVLAPTPDSLNACYEMALYYRTHFFIQNTERIESIYRTHCYGYTFANLFNYAKDQLFTVRLENVIQADGSNMIYVSVYNHDLQKTVLEPLPMDDYYWLQSGAITLQDDKSRGLSGEDLRIKYIGNAKYPFDSEIFELKVWESGKNGESNSCFTSKVTKPTCTAKGYTTRTCSLCGYSYKDTYVNAKGHSWKGGAVTDPTCTEQGFTTYTCACGETYQDQMVAALGHAFADWEITREPGCLEIGSRTRSCIRCSHTQQEELPALGHYFETYTSDGNATCLEDGTVTGICARCTLADTQPDPGSATGHKLSPWQTVTAPGCLVGGEQIRLCANCDYRESQTLSALGHSHQAAVTAPTCTEQGYTTHTCACGDSFVDTYTDPLGHNWEDPNAIHLECLRCGYAEGGFPVVLTFPEEENPLIPTEIWADGVEYPLEQENGQYIVYLPRADLTNLTVYTMNENATEDVHTQYPVGMKVWMLKFENDAYTASYIPEFENLLQYSGSSIRIVGVKGIRMITGIEKNVKQALTGKEGLAGYTLVEYGTALAWADEIDPALGLTLGQPYTKSNYAYGTDEKGKLHDPIFNQTATHIQYTNVLVGFNDDQCIPDIAMRPYIILKDGEGSQITIYGGMVFRNIGYIALQNRAAFSDGSAAYEYVWSIIHHVYGDRFDGEDQKENP